MTTEELMKPRYKCIADFPQAPYNEGDEHKFIEGDLLIQCNVNDAITFRHHGRLGHMSELKYLLPSDITEYESYINQKQQ